MNLFANCVLALNAATVNASGTSRPPTTTCGTMIAVPTFADQYMARREAVRRRGANEQDGTDVRVRPVNGKPVFPVEERPVPASDVPGDEMWPTQPFPLKPPPLVRLDFSEER